MIYKIKKSYIYFDFFLKEYIYFDLGDLVLVELKMVEM